MEKGKRQRKLLGDFHPWLNNKKILNSNMRKRKPCHLLGYCPFGQVVEEYPLGRSRFSCGIFGHDCPNFYLAENITE